MRNSLYDALEVSPSASVSTIQAALRAVVRRFWSVPRDASGDSEEAVRFAALAASILVDPIRRKDYDAALNPGVGAGPWRLPISGAAAREAMGARDAAAESISPQSRSLSEDAGELSALAVDATPAKSLPGVDALAEPLADGRAWSSPLVWVALLLACVLLLFACVVLLPDWTEFSLPQAVAVAATAIVLSLIAAFAVSRPSEAKGPAAGLSRLGIIKWRREGSIFIGVPPPQHDTAWIFKLRLMELTRSSAGFITATSVWRRLVARAVDYAWIALAIYGLIAFSDRLIDMVDPLPIMIRSPLILPVIVVLIAVPLEAFALRVLRTTPGKWLLGLMLVTAVTRPADHAQPSLAQLCWARASRAAWTGAALGVWPIAIIRSVNNWRDARDREADWEARGDSVVMARPMTAPAVAIALVVLLATALILASGWRRDYVAFWPYALTWAATTDSHLSRLLMPQPTDPGDGAARSASNPPELMPAPSSALPAPAAINPPSSSTVPPVASVNPAIAAGQSAATEAQMSQQASAAHARRIRIDGYMKQAAIAQRSGNYAGLQGNCQSWTVEQPGNALAWRCLGLAQYQNGAGRDALPALRQSLKLGSKDPQVEDAILRILRP